MKKKIITSLAGLFSVLLGILFYNGYPLVISANKDEVVNYTDTANGIIKPLANIDFTKGNNYAYFFLSKNDIKELPNGMSKRKLFDCRDNTVLQELNNNFEFVKSNGDMVTCESQLFIYKDGKLIFHSAFIFTDSIIGMQNSITGWADAASRDGLKKALLKFKPVNKPIVRL